EPQRVTSFQHLCRVQAPLRSPAEGEDADRKACGVAGNPRRQGQQLGVEHSPGPDKPVFCGAPKGISNGLAAQQGLASPCRAGSLLHNSLLGKEDKQISVSNCLLYYLVNIGIELDNENFYILIFPFWMWNLDPFVGQRLVIICVLVMYLGQCTKDIIRWPRPASPPVVKLEILYNSEYSMPSTHAVSGTAIPIAMVLLTYGHWQYTLI
ncbi:sphingosine-1-phosphate phosphatase 1, partial [Sigmodon hispidus]